MGWDGAGSYNRQHNFSADASAGIKILAVRMDAELDDVASAIPIALAKNGQNVPTANLPMGGFRHINVGAPTSVNNYMRSREFIENVPIFMDDTASSADRISVSAQYFTSVSANQAPGDGTRVLIRAKSDKSTAALYLNGHSANVAFQDGTTASGAMVSGGIYELIFSSADAHWQITSPGYGRTAAERTAGVTPDDFMVPSETRGALFEARYASKLDWQAVAQNATLHGVAARTFEVGVNSTGLAAFYAEEAVTEHAHYAFLDNSEIAYAGGAPIYGHASFDCNVTFTGAVDSDHHNSFQSYPHYSNSGTVDRLNGFYSTGDFTTGTVTAYSHVRIDDPTGAGTITTQYGVYIAALVRGGTNYAFYADGQAISHLGYKITLGAIATPATIEYVSNTGNLDITPRSGFKIRSVGPHEFTAPPVLPTYTVATVPSAATYARGMIYVSDEAGGAVPAFSDGANWRRVTDRAVVS